MRLVTYKNSKGATTASVEHPVPGILPGLFARHVMGHTAFLALSELA